MTRIPDRLPRLLVVGGLLAMVAVLALAQQGLKDQPAVRILPPQPVQPLVAAGPEPDLEILFTSEVMGFYQPCG